tara:strand:+ start:799 stop:1566 length:768 start_codon:yes stop_codon:yes gene_type:complete
MKHKYFHFASLLDNAAKSAQPIAQLSIHNEFDINDAYQIQKLSISQKLERGEKLTGYKLGFTSKAKMEQMGVHEVIWGRLTNAMAVENGGSMEIKNFIHPRAEPEIAFRVSKRIDSELTIENVQDHFDAVAGAIEIIDSRYDNFKFSLEDVVADNCSSSAYVIGEWMASESNVRDLSISLDINNETVQNGNSNAILGDPIESLIEMSKMAMKYDEPIEVGMIVLAGAATSAEFIKQGDEVSAKFDILNTVSLKVK